MVSCKDDDTKKPDTYMSIFNPEREEMDLERFEDYQEK